MSLLSHMAILGIRVSFRGCNGVTMKFGGGLGGLGFHDFGSFRRLQTTRPQTTNSLLAYLGILKLPISGESSNANVW